MRRLLQPLLIYHSKSQPLEARATERSLPMPSVCCSGEEKVRVDFGHGDIADIRRELVLPTRHITFR